MSRSRVFAGVLALVLSAAAVGALTANLLHSRQGPREPVFHALGPRWEGALNLDPDQIREVRAILTEHRERMMEIHSEIRPRVEAELEATNERIEAVLTPEQTQLFHDRIRRFRGRRARLGGPPRRGPRARGHRAVEGHDAHAPSDPQEPPPSVDER